MKITTLSLLSLLFGICVHMNAQNWAPILADEEHAFTTQPANHAQYFISTLESIGDSVVLQTSLKNLNGTAHGMFLPNLHYADADPLLGHAFTKLANGDYVFHKLDLNPQITYVIKPQAKINHQWMINPLQSNQAQVTTLSVGNVLGVQDSLKTIVFSQNQDTIVLSKNHGIVRFKVGSQDLYLSGLHDKGLGVSAPQWMDIYDFEVGDILMVKENGQTSNNGINTNETYSRIEIINATKDANAYHYTYKETAMRTLSTYNPTDPSQNTHNVYRYGPNLKNVTITAQSQDFLYDTKLSQFTPNTLLHEQKSDLPEIAKLDWDIDADGRRQLMVSTYLMEQADSTSIFSNFPVLYNSCYMLMNTGAPCITLTEDLGVTKVSTIGFEHAYNFELIGYIKNGDTTGTIYTESYLLELDQAARNIAPTIVPNPSEGLVSIHHPERINRVEVYSLTGRKVFEMAGSRSQSQELNLQELPPQVYILRVLDQDGNYHQTKLILTK